MDKQKLVNKIFETLSAEYESLKEIAEIQRSMACEDDMQQEGKYDTRRIEASYLAGAQAKRVQEVEIDIKLLSTFTPRDFKSDEEIDLGAIVDVRDEEDGTLFTYFITPCSGGLTVEFQNKKIQMLSINSPLAQEMLRLEVGDIFEFESPSGDKELEVLRIV